MLRSLLVLLFTISCANAAEADKTTEAIRANLQKNYDQLIGPVSQVNRTPMVGLFEVVTGDHIFYTDSSVQYLIDGNMFDLKRRSNITQARSRTLFAVDFNKLPLDLAVKKVKGDGSRKLAYFTDPNCGYCKKLEHELQDITNVTLYLFLYPIFEGSAEKVQGVLCSADKVKAWDDMMLNGVIPPVGNCQTSTEKIRQLGAKLKVNGTPALIFANGVINPGFMPAAQLDEALNKNK
jgi:thiol:disulfide interchange protein DsbC